MGLKIQEVIFINEVEDPEKDVIDVIVELSDGASYAFTVHTPQIIAELMDKEKDDFFYCSDLLVVRKINEDNIRKAVEDMIDNDCLDRIGIKQTEVK